MPERTTLVDFIARGDSPEEWLMVLVEEGPWSESIEADLRRIQDRLYGAIDAAVEGELAKKFPESQGKRVVIQLDSYNGPTKELSEFFDRFSRQVLATPDYRAAMDGNAFVSAISFRSNLRTIS